MGLSLLCVGVCGGVGGGVGEVWCTGGDVVMRGEVYCVSW